ncbi:unnamed protein product, partial [Hymenolepis diminuta]
QIITYSFLSSNLIVVIDHSAKSKKYFVVLFPIKPNDAPNQLINDSGPSPVRLATVNSQPVVQTFQNQENAKMLMIPTFQGDSTARVPPQKSPLKAPPNLEMEEIQLANRKTDQIPKIYRESQRNSRRFQPYRFFSHTIPLSNRRFGAPFAKRFNCLKNDDHIEESVKSTDPIPPPRRQNNPLPRRRRCRSKPGLIILTTEQKIEMRRMLTKNSAYLEDLRKEKP